LESFFKAATKSKISFSETLASVAAFGGGGYNIFSHKRDRYAVGQAEVLALMIFSHNLEKGSASRKFISVLFSSYKNIFLF
jgi:hypothetical protein